MLSERDIQHGPQGFPDLAIGRPVDVGVATRSGIEWYRSRVEGHDAADGRVAVAWPMARRELVPLEPGQMVVLAASNPDDALYSAEMYVEHTLAEEPPRVLLRPDAAWQRVQRRQDVRMPVLIRPTVAQRQVDGRPQPIHATIVNLSAGGLMLRSEHTLRVADLVDLTFGLSSGGGELHVRVDVRRVEHLQRGTHQLWEAGCQFLASSAADRDRIVRFIFAQQRVQARRQRGL